MTTNGTTARVALITGGASGIGLSITERLVKDGWKVTVVDYNEANGQKTAERLGSQITFLKADVTDYEQLSSTFVKTWDQHHRLDFVFANAGLGDLQNFYEPVKDREDGSPAKPNVVVVDVCLYAVIHSAWLALHYFRKNDTKSGRFVSTSSMCGLYPGTQIPLYTAAKHGVVGMTVAMGKRLEELGEPITINCICPGLVDTGLTNSTLMPYAPQALVTPHSTIVKAVMSFIDDSSKNGLAAECSLDQVYYRSHREWSDKAAEQLMTGQFESAWKDTTEKEQATKRAELAEAAATKA